MSFPGSPDVDIYLRCANVCDSKFVYPIRVIMFVPIMCVYAFVNKMQVYYYDKHYFLGLKLINCI